MLLTDVADADQVEAAAAAVEAHLGPIDIWVNDAMVSVFSPMKEMTPEEFRRGTAWLGGDADGGALATRRPGYPQTSSPQVR